MDRFGNFFLTTIRFCWIITIVVSTFHGSFWYFIPLIVLCIMLTICMALFIKALEEADKDK
jgi:hypothetical protein